MNRFFYAAVTFLFFSFLFSCQDAGLFSGDEPSAEIITLEEGIILGSEDEIPIEIFFEGESPSSFSITLVDSAGDARGVVTLQEDELAEEIPPLDIPEGLEEGYYELNLELFSGEEILTSRILPFFLFENQPHIHGLTSFPLVFYPGGKGLVFLESYIPSGFEPWIRWSFEGEVIASGLLSDGLDRVEVMAPETSGFYTLTAEMVPMPPVEDEEWEFVSPLRAETLISVDENIQIAGNMFGQSGSFYSLFLFQGEYNDWGVRETPIELYSDSEPDVDVLRGFFGYRMEPLRTFNAEGVLFPISEEGELEPFSVCLSFFLDEVSSDRRIFFTGTDGFSIDFSTDFTGRPEVRLSDGNNDLVLFPEEPLEQGVFNPLIISVYPDYVENRLTLSLYSDGLYFTVNTVEWLPEDLTDVGETVIGGLSGGADLLDGLGVYFLDEDGRPAVADSLFRKNALDTYGEDLVFADGFDSLDLSQDFLAENDAENGSFTHPFGFLELAGLSSISFPGLPFEDAAYMLEIAIGETEAAYDEPPAMIELVTITGETESVIGSVPLSEGLTGLEAVFSFSKETVIIDDNVFLTGTDESDLSDTTASETTDTGEQEVSVFFRLFNPGENPLVVEDVMIVNLPAVSEGDFSPEYQSE